MTEKGQRRHFWARHGGNLHRFQTKEDRDLWVGRNPANRQKCQGEYSLVRTITRYLRQGFEEDEIDFTNHDL